MAIKTKAVDRICGDKVSENPNKVNQRRFDGQDTRTPPLSRALVLLPGWRSLVSHRIQTAQCLCVSFPNEGRSSRTQRPRTVRSHLTLELRI